VLTFELRLGLGSALRWLIVSGNSRLSEWWTFGIADANQYTRRLSHRNSVRLSVTRVDQSKTVQARITKFSPSAAWKTLVSGTVKTYHKFEGGHPERGR